MQLHFGHTAASLGQPQADHKERYCSSLLEINECTRVLVTEPTNSANSMQLRNADLQVALMWAWSESLLSKMTPRFLACKDGEMLLLPIMMEGGAEDFGVWIEGKETQPFHHSISGCFKASIAECLQCMSQVGLEIPVGPPDNWGYCSTGTAEYHQHISDIWYHGTKIFTCGIV